MTRAPTDASTLIGLDATLSDGVIETQATDFDVSRLGVALSSQLLWEPGTKLTVRFRLSNGQSAVARAIVNRLEGDTMVLGVVATGPIFSKLFARTLDSLRRGYTDAA